MPHDTKKWKPPSWAIPFSTRQDIPDYAIPAEGEEPEGNIFSDLVSGAGRFFQEHPRVREVGQRLLTGTSPEFEQMLEEAEISRVLGQPESELSILPSIRRQPETYWGGFTKSLYEDIIRPLATPSGIVGSSGIARLAGIRPPRVIPPERQLPAGPRFVGAPEGVIGISAGQEFPPIRRAREIPYRAPESLLRAEPTERAVMAKSERALKEVERLEGEFSLIDRVRGREIPVVSRPYTPKDYASDIALMKARGQEVPPELEALANKPESKAILADEFLEPGEPEPFFARSEKGGIRIGQNIERSAQELTTGYSRPLEQIMMRESLQNAIDATRPLGESGNIGVRLGKDFIEVSDNGKGMSRAELETVFSDLHESGKVTEVGSTGGKGVGKASYILGGDRFKAETVVFEKGQKVKRTIEGTPKDFMTHVDIKEEVVPLQTPTGTTIKTTIKEGQEQYYIRAMLDQILEDSRDIQSTVKINKFDIEESAESVKFSPRTNDKIIDSTQVGDNNVTIAIPSNVELKPRTYIGVTYLNNGMFQFRKNLYLSEEVPNMPDKLLVDIKPLVEEGSPTYPFPVQRESIKEDLSKQIDDLINLRLAFPNANAKKMKLKELYESLPVVPSATTRKFVFFDPGNRLTPDELIDFQTSPVINMLATHFDGLYQDMLSSIGRENWINQLEGVGIVLDPNMHGIHIPNPSAAKEAPKSTILINPFEHISTKSPRDASLKNITTALHEAAHIGRETDIPSIAFNPEEIGDPRIGKLFQSYLNETIVHGGRDMGHGISFVKRLGEVYAKFGPRKTLSAADNLERVLTDRTGRYSPEVQRLLQLYKESRGRTATTEDFLSGTGIGSKIRPGGEGGVSGTGGPDGEGIVKRAVEKLFTSLDDAKDIRGQQQDILRIERAKRFAAFEAVTEGGVAGAKKQLSKLAGEFERLNVERLQMSPDEVDTLFTAIKQAQITAGEKARGYTALFKLLEGGRVPQRNELAILDSVFGGGFADRIIELQGGLGAVPIKIAKTANTMKAAMSSVDLSAPLRQGIGLAHRPEWRQAFADMHRFFGSKGFYDAAMNEIQRRPTYLLGREAGLFIADPKSLMQAEEAFMNNYIYNLPKGAKGLFLRTGVEASERAYTGFLNTLRQNTFDNMVRHARSLGHEMFTVVETTTEEGVKRSIQPTKEARAMARYINYATGRGGLGRLEKITPELNAFIWSPKLLSSRIGLLANPKIYTEMPKGMRIEAAKSLLNLGAMYLLMNGLAAAGAGTVSYNILSSDFGKLRRGNRVIDPYGGFQQPIVAAARFITASNEAGPQGRGTTAWRFAQSKLSPMASFMNELIQARPGSFTDGGRFTTQYGQETTIPRELGKRFAPMFLQDLTETIQSDPSLAELVGLTVPALYGASKQEYPQREARPTARSMPRRMRR